MSDFNFNTILISIFGFVLSTGVAVVGFLLARLIRGFDHNFEECKKAIALSGEVIVKNAERFQEKIEKLDEKLQTHTEKMRDDIARRDSNNHEEFRAIREHLHRISGATHQLATKAAVEEKIKGG